MLNRWKPYPKYEPDEQEIADCLVEYIGKKNVFASIVKDYKFVECETE